MKPKMHMIGNAHIDPVWLWTWQEGFQEIKATFRSALDRIGEYPEFRFTTSSAAFFAWIEHNDPDMFEEIRRRVAEGRIEIVGGWWVQPDCNLPCGESFVRQGLYGQRYFHSRFGLTAETGYNVDSFGHHGMLPQILRKMGLRQYVFMRPNHTEKNLPRLFWWESADGSRVLTYRIPFRYQTWGHELRTHIEECAAVIQETVDEIMCFYGVGNHGGGPTKMNIEQIRRLNGEENGLPALEMSTPGRYFQAVRGKSGGLPVVRDDFQHHASGCYAVHSGIKRWNREAEHLLMTVEKWASVAERLTGQPYPAELEQAWKNVLFNQFHDILAGTSIEPAYKDARDQLGEAMSIGSRALNNAIQALSWRIGIEPEEGMRPIVVFNPHVWESKVNVSLEFSHPGNVIETAFKETDMLVDESGRPVPFQLVSSLALMESRTRLCFTAELPALGYRVYKVVPARQSAGDEAASPVNAEGHLLENEYFRLRLDPGSGNISSLLDKRSGISVFRGEAAAAVVYRDNSDTWSHRVLAFDEEIGRFKLQSIRCVERGPVRAVIRVTSAYGSSVLQQDYTMYAGLDYIDVRVTVDWREQRKLLKLLFPLALRTENAVATYEIPYGFIERERDGLENPGQSWLDVSGVHERGERYGVALINDGKYSFSVKGVCMAITVLRSPIYAHHDPVEPDPHDDRIYIDQGVQSFSYRLLPHAGGWKDTAVVRRAQELNRPPITLLESFHTGPLPLKQSFAASDAEHIVVQVIKKAEDGGGWIVRAHETKGVKGTTRIKLPLWHRTIEADFAPCEIKTFLLPDDPQQPVEEVNLLEWREPGDG